MTYEDFISKNSIKIIYILMINFLGIKMTNYQKILI